MNLNKKIIISLSIIAVLLIYLFLRTDKKSVDLPEIGTWEKEADEIIIKKGKDTIRIYKKDNNWVIGDKAFPADDFEADNLEMKMRDLKITDFVSKSPYYEKYNLTPDKAIIVTVKKDDKVERDILIGKVSSTNRNTYIKFSDKNEIYLASGRLTDEFDTDVAKLRDKDIHSLSKENIESLELRYKGKKITLTKVTEEKKDTEKSKENDQKDKKKEKKKKEVKWICKEFKRAKIIKNKVNTILSAFSSLKANSFPEMKKESLKTSFCIVKCKAYDNNKTFELKIHKMDKDDNYICTSSESPYVFTLTEGNAKKFFKTISDFAEKKKKKKKKK